MVEETIFKKLDHALFSRLAQTTVISQENLGQNVKDLDYCHACRR